MTGMLVSGKWLSIALVLTSAVVAGCAPQPSSQEVRLIASARPYERDLPIPAGFAMVDEASEDRSTGVSRLYLRHTYRGQADKHAVRSFYREQMPLTRWSKVSDGNVQGRITLRFEKGSESCTIEIRDSGSGLRGGTEVQVLVSQEQRGPNTGDAQIKRN